MLLNILLRTVMVLSLDPVNISLETFLLIIFIDEASKYIEELIKLCPEWLSVHEINTNRVLKIDKTVNMQVIYEKIEKGNLA